MATSLAEIRAKLQAQENRGQGGNSQGGGDNAIYAHWNITEGTNARVRFLPDADTKNTFFWVERAMIKLPFAGVKGSTDSKQVIVNVPCMEMYGETCPILSEVRGWFKDPALEDMGRKYWKKRSYLFQGFVVDSPLKEDKTPENPIRRFIIGPQIFNTIKSALMDPELEELPTDYLRGLDFRISKGSKGGFADYNGSKWARKESALTEEEQAAIEKHGLFDLSSFLPKKPTEVEMKVIKEMFEASVDGQPYDTERWGQYFRPAGVQAPGGAKAGDEAAAPAADAKPTLKVVESASAASSFDEEDDTPVASAPVTKPAAAGGQSAQDILAMIRSRQTKQ
mgnify:CR=1 FL=1